MADFYWVGTGNWDATTTNWRTTSGGSTLPVAAPTTADDVYFDANSAGNCTTVGTRSCRNLYFRGPSGTSDYTGTFTLAAGTLLTVGAGALTGNVTLSPSMTFGPTGTGTLVGPTGSGRILTSNNKTFIGNFRLTNGGGSITKFADSWTIQGNLESTANSSTLTSTVVGSPRTITVIGSCTGALFSGFITEIFLKMAGTGTLAGNITSCNIQIDSPGQTVTQNALSLTSCNFTWTQGNYNSTALITMAGASTFNNVSSINFHSLDGGGGGGANIILTSNMNILNNLVTSNGSGSGFGFNGLGFNLNVAGNVVLNSGGAVGTATIVMNGASSASITHVGTGTGIIQNNLTINKSGAAVVTILPALTSLTWGITGRSLLTSSSAQFNPGTSTVTTPNSSSVTISENITFWNFNPGTNTTINII